MDDLARCVRDFEDWYRKPGKPNDPPEISSPRYDYLSEMTLADYLTKVLHCDPIVVDFYTSLTTDCMGGTAHSVNAHSGICFLSSEYVQEGFAYPGGTSEIAARLVRWLAKSGKGAAPEIRLNAVALRVDADVASAQAGRQRHLFQGRKIPQGDRRCPDRRDPVLERAASRRSSHRRRPKGGLAGVQYGAGGGGQCGGAEHGAVRRAGPRLRQSFLGQPPLDQFRDRGLDDREPSQGEPRFGADVLQRGFGAAGRVRRRAHEAAAYAVCRL